MKIFTVFAEHDRRLAEHDRRLPETVMQVQTSSVMELA